MTPHDGCGASFSSGGALAPRSRAEARPELKFALHDGFKQGRGVKFAVQLLIAGLLFPVWAQAATTIISVSAANTANEQDVRLDANSVVAVHWTQPAAYNNVTVSAKLYCTPCTGKSDASYADAYLTTQIGPTVTTAQQIAYARVKVSGTRSFVTLFSGLTLPAGDYYLVIYSPLASQSGSSGSSTVPALAWVGTSDANVVTAAVPGASRENMLIYSNNSGGMLINAKFPPSSFFFRSPTTASYDLTGSYNLQYQVTSTPSIFIPQVVSGAGWKTTFALVNMDQGAVTYTIKFWDDDGKALPLSLASGGIQAGTLAPGATAFVETSGALQATLLQGSAEIASSGKLGVSVGLRQTTSSANFEAALTATAPTTSYSFAFDNVQGSTAIALANGNGTVSLSVSLQGITEDGKVAEGSVSLPPHGHTAFPLAAVLPSLAGMRGALKISAPTPDLTAISLRFDPSGSFTSVPALQ